MSDAAITIYHGSSQSLPEPVYDHGKTTNDYGRGFYCTENLELAKEWACADGRDGVANKYTLNTEGLSILRLNSQDYHILNWLSILLDNRTFNISQGIASRAKQYLLATFLPDYRSYDIIVGYRADDSYFAYAGDFIDNTLSFENLSMAMRLGKLGEQVVLISQKAFKALTFVEAIPASAERYYVKYINRDRLARADYQVLRQTTNPEDGTYVMDIIRSKMQNDDPRLR